MYSRPVTYRHIYTEGSLGLYTGAVKKSLFLLYVFIASFGAGLYAQSEASLPEFSPPEWKYGMIGQGDIVKTKVVATNRAALSVKLTFVPTCTCLTVSPETQTIAPGGSATFALSFDSKDYEGKTQRAYIVKTDVSGAKPLYYLLSGVVRVDRPASNETPLSDNAGVRPASTNSIVAQYYYTLGCHSCEDFLSVEIPNFEARYGIRISLDRRDLLDPSVYEELAAFASSRGVPIKAIPVLRIGNELLQGEEEIRDRLPGLLLSRNTKAASEVSGGTSALTETSASAQGISASLAALPVMAAGLIDGVNPCAFTTLVFLLASLALAGKGRHEILIIGALFSLGVFLTYMGIGFGLFAALRAAGAVALVSTIIRWVLVTALVMLAALSVYDYTRIKAGKASEILLQLPNSLKLKIHASIRTRVRTAALAGSSFVLGFFVSIFEFACTGQVYLPTLAYLARTKGKSNSVLLLVLYNLCFIAPLLAVFAASYLGVSSKRIGAVFQKRMGAVKLGLAIVFLGLAALTLFS